MMALITNSLLSCCKARSSISTCRIMCNKIIVCQNVSQSQPLSYLTRQQSGKHSSTGLSPYTNSPLEYSSWGRIQLTESIIVPHSPHVRWSSDACATQESEEQELLQQRETENHQIIPSEVLDPIVNENQRELESVPQVVKKKKQLLFEPVINPEIIDDFAPECPPSYNIAAYVNKSSTLQQLIKLGVNLSKFDKDLRKVRFILSLKFDEDIKPHLLYLHDLGVPADMWGKVLTVNPFILQEDLETLQQRVNYLLAKKFSSEAIATIIASYPKWLSQSIVDVDTKLGFLQRILSLTGDEVRSVATELPRLVFFEKMKIRRNHFILYEEYGFTKTQVKQLCVANPKILQTGGYQLGDRLKVLINKMELPHETIVQFPNTLTAQLDVLDNRHFFLRSLGRVQYDPTQPNYISPDALISVTDADFAATMARSSIVAYNMYLKTL